MNTFSVIPREPCEVHLRGEVDALLAREAKMRGIPVHQVPDFRVGPFSVLQLLSCAEQLERYRSQIANLQDRRAAPHSLVEHPDFETETLT